MSRKEKGGTTASQKATSIAAVGLFVFKGKGAIVWVLNSSSFQNRRKTKTVILDLIIPGEHKSIGDLIKTKLLLYILIVDPSLYAHSKVGI